MMWLDVAEECVAELRQLLPQRPACEVSKHVRVPLAVNKCCEHSAAAHAQDISCNRSELDVGAFRRLVDD